MLDGDGQITIQMKITSGTRVLVGVNFYSRPQIVQGQIK